MSSEKTNVEELISSTDLDENNEKAKFLFSDNETIENIKQNSPFRTYFNALIAQYRMELHLNVIRKKHKIENEFYCQSLFYIIDDKLHLMPLWSGIMIGEYQAHSDNAFINLQTRLTNNSVGNYFKELKYSILNNQNNLLTSELATKCYNRIQAKYIEKYYNRSEIHKDTFDQKKNHLSNSKEKWKKKKKTANIGVKGFYYKKQDTWDLIKDKVLEKKVKNTNLSEKNNQEENNFAKYKILFSDLKRLYNDQIEFFESLSENEQFFQNRSKFVECIKILRSINESKLYDNQLDDPRFDFILSKNKMDFMVPIWCCPDGNCFWYSISNLLFGSDNLFYIIKVSSIFMLLEYRSEIESILKRYDYDMSLETLIEKTMKVDEFSNELNILATCIAINRPIYSFGGFDEEKTFAQKYELECNRYKKPLNLGFLTNHFVALLSKEKNFFQNNIENDVFVQFKKILKLKKYD
jgi:hypothetical protein